MISFLPIEGVCIELAPYCLLQCWVTLQSNLLLEGNPHLDRIKHANDKGLSGGGEREGNNGHRHAHLLLVGYKASGVVLLKLAVLNLSYTGVCWIQVGLVGGHMFAGDDFPAPLCRYLHLHGAVPGGVVVLGRRGQWYVP